MTKLTMKQNKQDIFSAYNQVSNELEKLKKQLKPKPTTKEITKAVSLSLTDARLSATLRQLVFDVCSILAYIYVAGAISYDYLTKTINQVTELCHAKFPEVKRWTTPLSFDALKKTVLNLN